VCAVSLSPLRLTLVQGATRWHDAEANRGYYADLVRSQAGTSDLYLLPEMFLTGFTNETGSQSDTMDGQGLEWMRSLASEVGAVITGSLVIREKEHHLNRLLWVRPDGSFEYYDKRHLFRMAGEQHHYAAGKAKLTVELNGWRIRPLVCYDLRFPIWSRNEHDAQAAGGMAYDLVLFVANWPAPRRQAWCSLLRARAIENLAYCAGVNRVGTDGNAIAYAGDSAVIDPYGSALVDTGDQQQVVTVHLDPGLLLAHRERFPAWMDADRYRIED
jgi:omega-amidase